MSKHHQSREEWEQEFRDVQRNILPHEELRSASIIARRVAEEDSAPIRSSRHLVFLLSATLFFAAGITLIGSAASNRDWVYGGCALLAFVVAALLGFASIADRFGKDSHR